MRETSSKTEARVVGVVTAHTSRRSYSGIDQRTSLLFFPSVRFQTADGRTIEGRSWLHVQVQPQGLARDGRDLPRGDGLLLSVLRGGDLVRLALVTIPATEDTRD